MDKDPENLVKRFVEDLLKRQGKIVEKVKALYLLPGGEEEEEEENGGQWKSVEMVHFPKKVLNLWKTWTEQVPVFGFNSGRYDINMIKEYFVKNLAGISDVNVAKKENSYMFLSLPQFKFLDIKSYLARGLSYAAWCRAY